MDKHNFGAMILHEYKLDHSAAEATLNINRVWGKVMDSKRTLRLWFSKFRSGDMSLEDKLGRGQRPALENYRLREAVQAASENSTHTLAGQLWFSHMTVGKHLAEIEKAKKMIKWIPHELSDQQCGTCYGACCTLLVHFKNESFLDRLITD